MLPADCLLCQCPLDTCTTLPICSLCLAAVVPQSLREACLRCAAGLEPDSFAALRDHLCDECREKPPAFERVVAFGEYTGELRELIHLLKFSAVHPIAHFLALRMAEALEPHREALGMPLVITAVPLFADRQRQRGFNQARVLAVSLAGILRNRGWEVEENYQLLVRSRATRSQSELNYQQRRANLRGVFKPGPQAAGGGSTVLLIDDIVTTAATARHCARVLQLNGNASVWVVAAARSQFENRAAAFHMHAQSAPSADSEAGL